MKKYRIVFALVFIIFIWFVFYNVKTVFTNHLFPITNDTLQYFWPEIVYSSESIKNNTIPLWNPFIEFGESQIGRSFTVFFSPINIFLLRLFSAKTICVLSATIPVFLGGLGVFSLARLFKLTIAASLISSVAYLNSGILQVQFYHLSFLYGLILLPWILYSIEYFLTRRLAFGVVFLTSSFAVLFLCANPQYIFYNIIASLLYFIVRLNIFGSFGFREARFKRAMILSGIFLLTICIASLIGGIQTLMTYDLLENSQRIAMKGSVNYEGSLFPFLFILHYFPSILIKSVVDWFQNQSFLAAPSLFVGVIPSVLATRVFFNKKATSFHRRQLYALIAIFCLGWFIASAKYNLLYIFIFKMIPTFGIFRFPVRALFMSVLSISLLAGFGYDFIFGQYSESYPRKGYFFVSILSLGLLFYSVYSGLYKNLSNGYLFLVGFYISIVYLIMSIVFVVGYCTRRE